MPSAARPLRAAGLALAFAFLAWPGWGAAPLELAFSASGKLNAPLDLALGRAGGRAYALEADGDVVELGLDADWNVVSRTARGSIPGARALTLAPDGETLWLGQRTQLLALPLPDGAPRPVGVPFPAPVTGVVASPVLNALWVLTEDGAVFAVAPESGARRAVGHAGQALSDGVFDPMRGRLYLSTPRGTVLSFDPETGASRRLAFVGPPLGRLDLDADRLFVTSVDFGLYVLDLGASPPTPELFFPRVAGPSALAVRGGRALVTNVAEGLVRLAPLDLSGPLASRAQIVVPPALGPVRSVALDAARGFGFVGDAGYALWSLRLPGVELASFVFTPFDGRVAVHPTDTVFYATNRRGGQVLGMRFDPPFAFGFDQPPISPVLAAGLPDPDGIAFFPDDGALYVGTRGDGRLWRVRPERLSAEPVADLPAGARSIDLAVHDGSLLVLQDRINGDEAGRLWRFDPPSGRLEPLADDLPPSVDVAAHGTCAYVASGDGRLVALDLDSGQWRTALRREGLSAVALDAGTLYVGTAQGELWRTAPEAVPCP